MSLQGLTCDPHEGRLWDAVGGHRLREGERVRVVWPDGSTTVHDVVFVPGQARAEAAAYVEYHGARLPVPLRALPARDLMTLEVTDEQFRTAVRDKGIG